jgi:hypothetical protein
MTAEPVDPVKSLAAPPEPSAPFGLPAPAIEHFNKHATELLLQLRPFKPPPTPPGTPNPTSASHEIPVHSFTDENSRFARFGAVTPLGEQLSRGFPTPTGDVGLDGPAYKDAEKLCDGLASKREIRPLLSGTFVTDTFFDWLRDLYAGVLPVGTEFLTRLAAEASKAIRPRKISHPILFLVIEKPFKIGHILFEFLTPASFDILDRALPKQWAATPEMAENAKFYREKYQGKVCCSMVVTAESHRAVEIARRETDRALVILRCFGPTVFVPQIPSYFDRMGIAHVPGYEYLEFEEVHDEADPSGAPPRLAPTMAAGSHEKRQWWTELSEEDIRQLDVMGGLTAASQLLTRASPTDLEQLLLNSYTLFSRGLLSTDFQDRVVFAVVSLETLLLKNSSEPLMANGANRVAYLAYRDKASRKKAKDTLVKAYTVRSGFLHHGARKAEDWELLMDLQHLVWAALQNVFPRINQGCKTRDDLLDALEDELME